jgi:hypothetical protein
MQYCSDFCRDLQKKCFREAVKKTAALRDAFLHPNAMTTVLERSMVFLLFTGGYPDFPSFDDPSKKSMLPIRTSIPINQKDYGM